MAEIVSFVILHYRDLETTDLCVQSILRLKQQERIRIVIVDNDVKDPPQQRQIIQEKYRALPQVSVLQVQENGGFSHANNFGYIYARKKLGSSFILLLNNDIELIQEDFLERLDRAYQEHHAAVLGPDIIRKSSGMHQNPLDTRLRTPEEAHFTSVMNRRALKFYDLAYPFLYLRQRRQERKEEQKRKKQEAYYQTAHEEVVLFGAFLIYTPEYVRKEEAAFSPETEFYYEEYILACRCQKSWYRMVYVPELKVLHESGVATKKTYAGEKERLRFVMKHVAESSERYLEYLQQAT